MAEKISGRLVSWGITAGVIAEVHSAIASGILNSYSIQPGGTEEVITDEDGDPVTRIDHGPMNKVNFEVTCDPDTTLPVKGSELTGIGTIDGIDFTAGRIFVDDPQVTFTNAAVKKISVAATHYPTMGADPA